MATLKMSDRLGISGAVTSPTPDTYWDIPPHERQRGRCGKGLRSLIKKEYNSFQYVYVGMFEMRNYHFYVLPFGLLCSFWLLCSVFRPLNPPAIFRCLLSYSITFSKYLTYIQSM